MYRLAWRSVNNTQHLVANQTVILSDSPVVAGIQWFDIVNPTNPSLDQQGVVSDFTGHQLLDRQPGAGYERRHRAGFQRVEFHARSQH